MNSRGKEKRRDTPAGKPSETKAERFTRLAKKRVNAAIVKIGYVSNCFGVAYAWTPEQAAKIIAALRKAVDAVEARSTKTQQRTDSFDF